MTRRDFKKSNLDYFNKNKIALICIGVFVLLGILLGVIFGFNQNFEMKGYNEFQITLSSTQTKYNSYAKDVAKIVNSYGGNYDSYQIYGEGDNTKFVVRYSHEISNENQTKINNEVADAIEIEVTKISNHVAVSPAVNGTSYLFTAAAILIIITIATLFAYFRYNGASAMAMLIGGVLANLLLMSFGTILRLQVGSSYFAMLVLLNVIVVYFAIDLFENIKQKSWLESDSYDVAISSATTSSKPKFIFISLATMLIGLLMVLIANNPIKYIAINLLFVGVVTLFIGLYAIPFVWSVFIPRCRKRKAKVKMQEVEN